MKSDGIQVMLRPIYLFLHIIFSFVCLIPIFTIEIVSRFQIVNEEGKTMLKQSNAAQINSSKETIYCT